MFNVSPPPALVAAGAAAHATVSAPAVIRIGDMELSGRRVGVGSFTGSPTEIPTTLAVPIIGPDGKAGEVRNVEPIYW